MKNILNKRKNLRIILYVFLTVVLLALGYIFFYEPAYQGLIPKQDKVLVFAHRGFGNYAPDNSLAGGKIAMQKNMDGIDVDGQLTIDNHIVIFHDLSLDRLTTANGKVTEKTLSEMTSLDLGEKYGQGFEGSFVTTFEEFVKEIVPHGILMVEFKVSSSESTGMEEEAAKIIEKYSVHKNVYISSFNPVVLYRLKKIDPQIRTVLIFMDTNWNPELLAEIKREDVVNYPWFLRQEIIRRAIRKIIRPDALSVNHEVDERVIDSLLKKGYPVFLWTIDEKHRLEWALDKKPYGIISDEPILTKELRDGKE